MENTVHEKILVLDFGVPYGQLVARKVRELKVYCEVLPYDADTEEIMAVDCIGVICVGGNKDYGFKVPVLDLDENWTEENIKTFLYDVVKCKGTWTEGAYTAMMINAIKNQVGDNEIVLGLSGGVDSSVCAALIHEAVGDKLTCIFVNTGLMRKNEPQEVERVFSTRGVKLVMIDAEKRFLDLLKGVDDPEKKRKIIGAEFIKVFEEEAKKYKNAKFLAQGTIYPDIIESGNKHAETIKSHHNVGGLPEHLNLELCEPVKYLFKDEVRKVGEELGLPHSMVWRHPFPGPGLGVRCVGALCKERLDILREADAIFVEEIRNAGLYDDIWQAFAQLLPIKSVGARDGKRTYNETCVLRAIHSKDAMTAKPVKIPFELLEKVAGRILNEVEGINRVLFDISPKPPATIEWE
ncbi:MAG: glutamine-hydrolyzing GMP synthase [Abditibacteriota bacterium]|nr:glutamine-hydrolyzing GMP synthase [Abditibacteriota bacterium]